jgi:hypothetical protein
MFLLEDLNRSNEHVFLNVVKNLQTKASAFGTF